MEIVVVGAGFAGVWVAAGAVRTAAGLGREEDVTVTVVAPGEDMVIRPRLYEDDPSRMRVALDRVLGPIGVRRVSAEITGVDVDAHRVTGRDHDGNPVELAYDKLVLATGSTLVSPQLPGAEHLFDVDTIEAADALHQHIAQLSRDPQRPGAFTAVVVGGGFTGLEVATELPSRLRAVAGEHPVRVVMLDRADVAGRALGDGPRPEIEAATVIWTAGMRAQVLTEQIPGERDDLGRLVVDEQLHVTGVPDVFAAGDTASARRTGAPGDAGLPARGPAGQARGPQRGGRRPGRTARGLRPGGLRHLPWPGGRCPHRRLGPRGPAARGGGQAA